MSATIHPKRRTLCESFNLRTDTWCPREVRFLVHFTAGPADVWALCPYHMGVFTRLRKAGEVPLASHAEKLDHPPLVNPSMI